MSDVIAVSSLDVCELWLSRAFSALEACGAEPIDTAYVAAGAIAWDTCCGLLVVAPERTYRSAQFPIEGTTDYVCESAFLVVDVVILLLRCVPTLDDRGNPPPVPALSAAYGSVLNDAAILWNVAAGELPEGWQRANVDQTYVGAQGGCVGVETRMSIGLAQHLWCPTCEPPGPEPDPIHVTITYQDMLVTLKWASTATACSVDFGDGTPLTVRTPANGYVAMEHDYLAAGSPEGPYTLTGFDDGVEVWTRDISLPARTAFGAFAGSPGTWGIPADYTIRPTELEMTSTDPAIFVLCQATPNPLLWSTGQHVITEDGKPVYPRTTMGWASGVKP